MRTYLFLGLGLGLAACGPNHLGGRIDGEGVGGARSAIYDTLGFEFGPLQYEAMVVIVTDFADACGVYEDIAEVLEVTCDDRCEEYIGIADERNLHADRYWSTTFTINTSEGVDGTFDYDPELGEDEFTTAFSSWDNTPLADPGACEDTCEDQELLVGDVEDGDEGTLELEEDDDLVRGKFDVSFGGEDGISGTFVAEPCDMTEWFELP